MALRLIQISCPDEAFDALWQLVDRETVIDHTVHDLHGNRDLLTLFVRGETAESILDALNQYAAQNESVRVVLLPVEATIPRLDEPTHDSVDEDEDAPKPVKKLHRISREELIEDVNAGSTLSPVFLLTTALAVIVAAVGLMKDNVAVIIGAMVIAPLLGPNVALAVGTTLGDTRMIGRAARANAAGIALALALATLIGLIFPVNELVPEIANRTTTDLADIVLALAAGCAGVVAVLMGLPTGLIGVMVAVALVPPLVAAGLLLGDGHYDGAYGALMLTAVNVISVNLMGTATLMAFGIRPGNLWEAGRAKRATWRAMAIWAVLLALLIVMILTTVQTDGVAG